MALPLAECTKNRRKYRRTVSLEVLVKLELREADDEGRTRLMQVTTRYASSAQGVRGCAGREIVRAPHPVTACRKRWLVERAS